MPAEGYSTSARRRYIQENLKRYRYGEKGGYSLRDIAWDITRAFDLEYKEGLPGVSWATVRNDLQHLRDGEGRQVTEEAAALLTPERFPEWRAKHFTAPNGQPYLTPIHQLALFHMIVGCALKAAPPEWVLTYLGLPPEAGADMENMEKLLTFLLLVAPRHGKTELVIHTVIWLIITNPNIRIIYCQGIEKTSQKAMGLIQWELEYNEKLVSAYGPFRDDRYRWNTEEFTVGTRTIPAVMPTFFPIGITSNVRSLSADVILIDDPQDLRRVLSETVVANDYAHVATEIMTRRETWTPVIGVGSHLPTLFGDLWLMIEESVEDLTSEGQSVYIAKLPAHNSERCQGEPHIECVLWPEMRPWWFLETQRKTLDKDMPGLFDVVYNQMPRAVIPAMFDPEWYKNSYVQPTDMTADGYAPPRLQAETFGVLDRERKWMSWPQCCGSIVSAIGFDPAASEKDVGAESALVIRAACARCDRRFIVDYWHKRQSPERNPDTIISYMRSYREYGLHRVRIEINAYQKSLAREPRLIQAGREYRFLIDEWTTDDRKNNPEMGIPLLGVFPRAGMLSIPAQTRQDEDYADAYIRAYKRYPRKPTDMVMADWLAELDIHFQLEQLKATVSETLEGYDDIPEYLQEQMYEFDLSEVWNN